MGRAIRAVMGGGAAAFRGARVVLSADQNVANGVETPISFDTVLYDTSGFWSAGQPTRLTIPAGLAGYYLIVAGHEWFQNATGTRYYAIELNGVTVLCTSRVNATAGGADTEQTIATLWNASAGDYFEYVVQQTSGGLLAAKKYAGVQLPQFSLYRLGT